MDKKVKTILSDIYAVDPSLKHHEETLTKVIIQLLKSKPNTKFDENFRRQLRAELMERIEEIKQKTDVKGFSFIDLFLGTRFKYAAGAAIIIILVIPAFVYYYSKGMPKTDYNKVDFGLKILTLGGNAFGSLDSQTQAVALERGTAETDSVLAKVQGFGGGGLPTTVAPKATEAMRIMPYDVTQYKYRYVGDEFKLDFDEVAVLRRTRGAPAGLALSGLLNQINFDSVNLSSFGSARVQNISFVQDKKYGYIIYVNFDEGMLSVYENWERWNEDCIADGCNDLSQILLKDMPADAEIIKIAADFTREHNIEMSIYGEPFIQKQWVYERVLDLDNYITSAVVQVIYPLVIDGKTVYSQSGTKEGLGINVNVTKKLVSGIWNLTSQTYESSSYEAFTDFSRILEIAGDGGYGQYVYPNPSKVVEIEIGAPKIELVKYYKYNEGKAADELLVPALVFPILKVPEGEYIGREAVIVPLAKDLLESSIDGLIPMPLLEKADAPDSTDE